MNTQQMRVALEQKYNKAFVDKMKDDQVIAVYKRLKSNNKI
jgi:hypothetical protein